MPKTQSEAILEVVAADLITYLGAGSLNRRQLTRVLDYTDLEIEDLDRLKRLHFALHEDVRAYVEALPKRLRRIKTQDTITSEVSRGAVRGAIDWPQTYEHRSKIGFDDPTVFVVSNPAVEIDIPENRIVKKLLAVVADPLTEDHKGVDQSWRSQWDEGTIARLKRTLQSNVYLDALPEPDDITISERDLTTARRARQPLYQEGADLYRLYTDLINDRYHTEEVATFLQETLITPSDETLFELFCVFALIRYLREELAVTLTRIQPDSGAIATMTKDTRRVAVYYDAGGPLSFYEQYPTTEELADRDVPEMLRRQAAAIESHAEYVDGFLSKGSQSSFYSGRPDAVVLQWNTDGEETLEEVLICEFKYTARDSLFSSGLRQLLEYIHLGRQADGYLFDESLDEAAVHGLLCTDSVTTETDAVGAIQHWDTAHMQSLF